MFVDRCCYLTERGNDLVAGTLMEILNLNSPGLAAPELTNRLSLREKRVATRVACSFPRCNRRWPGHCRHHLCRRNAAGPRKSSVFKYQHPNAAAPKPNVQKTSDTACAASSSRTRCCSRPIRDDQSINYDVRTSCRAQDRESC